MWYNSSFVYNNTKKLKQYKTTSSSNNSSKNENSNNFAYKKIVFCVKSTGN